jgi:hypothetical protein
VLKPIVTQTDRCDANAEQRADLATNVGANVAARRCGRRQTGTRAVPIREFQPFAGFFETLNRHSLDVQITENTSSHET